MPATAPRHDRSRRLLVAGLAAGVLFPLGSFAQAFIRDGFNIRRHGLSSLTLGDLGWLQIANFIGTGVLAILFAVAARRTMRNPDETGPAAAAGPLLIAIYGIGMIGGGLFHPDPALGWPVGTPDKLPEHATLSNNLHIVFAAMAFLSMIAAGPVFARRFAQTRPAWAMTSAVASTAVFVLTVLPWSAGSASLRFAAAAVLVSGLMITVAWRLRADHPFRRPD
ncbi:hypothetical protein GCM10010399_07240 [Dactylosporangium fulvum]|uniref:DUF998 domain-containing protein n=1 Tax=Dactylosporangium fulvum TaxID=53359 RepID=A0ABY5W9C0_9ACTN|nr:DUF998 domain-containing protein [Dactylosporangium fulvum]UWP86628.1 DUF998 domain-containing protein [Dactylosporangium fulvum]